MIQKFLSKYFLEVIPSIVATVVGAYIVTHYINSKPDADKPAAAASSPATPVKAVSTAPDKPKSENSKSEIASPESVKTESPKTESPKTESFRTELSKAESAKAEPEPAKSEAEKGGEKSAQAARVLRHHQVVVKERAAKAAVQEKAAPVEASATPEDRRDANDIARAAIERLRGAEPHAGETRPTERKLNTVGYAPALPPSQPPQTYAPPVQAAPPPAAYVPPPAREAAIPAPVPVITPMPPATTIAPMPVPPASVVRAEDPSRPTPPADIPSRPLDIRAKDSAKDDTSVAEDVVSAAKNAFQAVLPR